MPTACSSAATVCASKRRRKPSPLDRVQPLMERSHPFSGRSATPADISRNGRPTSIGTGGRHQSECPADIIESAHTWHLDEVVVKIAGKKHWLWRAVDQTGMVLDVLVQSRRDKGAAKRLLRKLLKKQCRAPRVMVTDKLASYGATKREIM